MKAVILCAGYATRLYPLTENTPKALLFIKNKPLINYTIEKIEEIEEIDKIYIVTNNKFYNNFLEWGEKLDSKKEIKIVNDKTTSNKDRLGGIGDLNFVIQEEKINDNILVILGDNLFDFNLKSLTDYFFKMQDTTLGVYKMNNTQKQIFGIVSIKDNKILSIQDNYIVNQSNIISTGFYVFTKSDIKRIKDYMETLKPKEGPGFLIMDWLGSKSIYPFIFEGKWFDIGNKEIYEEVNKIWN